MEESTASHAAPVVQSVAPASTDVVLIYATAPDANVARAIADALLAARLIACANLLAPMTSVYWWNGAVTADSEVPIILKTRADLAPAAIALARTHHPYETPAFLVVPVIGGHAPFLDWVRTETAPQL
jgi:periplasmic divalent cation tolerance protein